MKDQTLGHYEVVEQIGSWGMGEVYRARDQRLGREVALNILKPALTDDPDRLRRFEQEARSAAALSHPNIVAIYDIGTHRGTPFIVSELLQGQTLRERLSGGPLTARQAADYAGQIAPGLIAAHEKRIVHRDLKPENIFITRDGRIKILDFGIAKLVHAEFEDERSVATMTTQTKTGSVLGTVAYMSPEQLRGQAVDHRSDIFSFGAILYEMLTGRRAFAAQTQVDTMTAVLKDDPPEISRHDVPPAFEQIVRHCLEKEPENRFQSARDLAFALSTVSNATTKPVPASLRAKLHIRRSWLALAAGLLLAVAGIFLRAALTTASSPTYQRLTFERGTVYSARFAADGRSVIYGASWSGRPLQLYSTMPDSLLGRPLGLSAAYLLAVSNTNELALSVHGTPGSRLEFVNGMLAQAPSVGGTPREILPDVLWADWSPAGSLAVVHHANTRDILEYPIGKILYQTNGAISNIRFSPRGDRIAFIDHPARFDNGGAACVIDLAGYKSTLSEGWQDAYGLAWSPRGDEVFFTAVENGSTNRSLWAVDLAGRQRKLLTVPGGFILQDVAGDGRVLATFDNERLAMEWAA